jgi:hypothetical protein
MTDARLRGKSCYLQPITIDDVPLLYRWETGSTPAFRWRLAGQHLNPQAYAESIWDGVLATFLIRVPTGDPVGVATAYSADFRNGHCYAALGRFDDDADRSPLRAAYASVEAFTLLIDYLFIGWNFRKIYLEVAEYNLPQFASLIGKACVVDGVLTDHVYLSDRYWSLTVLAISRPMWAEFRSRRSD